MCELRGCLLELGTQHLISLPLAHARHCEVHVCRGYGERTGRVFGRALARAVSVQPVCTSAEDAVACELRGCSLDLGTQHLVSLPLAHARHCEINVCRAYGERTGRVSDVYWCVR